MKNLLICYVFGIMLTNAQDLTGKWVIVENYNSDLYEELYLVAGTGNQYFGHSFDTQSGGFCRFWLKAKFTNGFFEGSDGELIDRVDSHHPSIYNLAYEKVGDDEFLVGTISLFKYNPYKYNQSNEGEIGSLREYLESLRQKFNEEPNSFNDTRPIKYKKVSDSYQVYDGGSPLEKDAEIRLDDIPDDPNYFDGEINEPSKPIAQQPTDSVNIKSQQQLKEYKEKRENKIISTIDINAKSFSIDIWDYNKEDGDRVSIFVNDSILINDFEISSKVKSFNIPLDPKVKEYRLVFIANNLGEIPPNSAQIKIRFGINGQRNYKLFTDDKTNAVIVINNKKYQE